MPDRTALEQLIERLEFKRDPCVEYRDEEDILLDGHFSVDEIQELAAALRVQDNEYVVVLHPDYVLAEEAVNMARGGTTVILQKTFPPIPSAQARPDGGDKITDAELAEWESERGNGMMSALGEYTPDEFWRLLDEVKRLRARPADPLVEWGNRPANFKANANQRERMAAALAHEPSTPSAQSKRTAGRLVNRLELAGVNVANARRYGLTEHMAGWEAEAIREAAKFMRDFLAAYEQHEDGEWSSEWQAMASRARALATPSAQEVPEPEDIDAQDWAHVGPAVAFHLIERHADDWAHAGRLMEAWRQACNAREAKAAQAQPERIHGCVTTPEHILRGPQATNAIPSAQVNKARGEWQPIEAAPKDGVTEYLFHRAGRLSIGKRPLGCPDDAASIGAIPVAFYPTHWMPLPDGPDAPQSARTEQCECDLEHGYKCPEHRGPLVTTPQPQGDASLQARPDGGEPVCWGVWHMHDSPIGPDHDYKAWAFHYTESHARESARRSNDALRARHGISEPRYFVEPLYTHPTPAPDAVARQWQPIETGPHSGVAVLLYQPWKSGRDCTVVGHYANGWVDRDCEEMQPEPTHWMPLPAAPFTAAQQESQ